MKEHAPTIVARFRARGRAVTGIAFAAVLAATWVGCSLKEDYEILSFFFDGVPDPNVPADGDLGDGRIVRAGVVYFRHQPFGENACAECHRGTRSLMMSRVDPAVCSKCHGAVRDAYPVMHGPVAADGCLWCHEPHQSRFEHLLKAPGTELCLQCHGLTFNAAPENPAHVDPEQACLDCHHGHGGTAPYFLVPPPSSEEAPDPETVEPADPGEP